MTTTEMAKKLNEWTREACRREMPKQRGKTPTWESVDGTTARILLNLAEMVIEHETAVAKEARREALEEVMKVAQKELPNILHNYGAWLINGGGEDEPLIRKWKKETLTKHFLAHLYSLTK